jgi:hypothetical protein
LTLTVTDALYPSLVALLIALPPFLPFTVAL